MLAQRCGGRDEALERHVAVEARLEVAEQDMTHLRRHGLQHGFGVLGKRMLVRRNRHHDGLVGFGRQAASASLRRRRGEGRDAGRNRKE